MNEALTQKEFDLIEEIKREGGLLRKLMDKEEIRMANQLVKRGVIYKGTSDDRQGTVSFFAW